MEIHDEGTLTAAFGLVMMLAVFGLGVWSGFGYDINLATFFMAAGAAYFVMGGLVRRLARRQADLEARIADLEE